MAALLTGSIASVGCRWRASARPRGLPASCGRRSGCFSGSNGRAEQRLVDSAKAELARLYALIDVDLIWVTDSPTSGK